MSPKVEQRRGSHSFEELLLVLKFEKTSIPKRGCFQQALLELKLRGSHLSERLPAAKTERNSIAIERQFQKALLGFQDYDFSKNGPIQYSKNGKNLSISSNSGITTFRYNEPGKRSFTVLTSDRPSDIIKSDRNSLPDEIKKSIISLINDPRTIVRPRQQDYKQLSKLLPNERQSIKIEDLVDVRLNSFPGKIFHPTISLRKLTNGDFLVIGEYLEKPNVPNKGSVTISELVKIPDKESFEFKIRRDGSIYDSSLQITRGGKAYTHRLSNHVAKMFLDVIFEGLAEKSSKGLLDFIKN